MWSTEDGGRAESAGACVHVWYRDTALMSEGDLEAALALLSDDERARHDRFHFARDRRDFAAAHALLRTTLSRYDSRAPGAWTFRTRPGGKPELASPAPRPLSFNLSHTHGLVACAVATGFNSDVDVGVDVEALDRAAAADEVAGRYFAAPDIAALRLCSEDEREIRFFELWTLKEAYLKACGSGLSHGLDVMSFIFDGTTRLVFSPPPGVAAGDWHFALFAPTPRHRMAVAVHAGACTVVASIVASIVVSIVATSEAGADALSPIRVTDG